MVEPSVWMGEVFLPLILYEECKEGIVEGAIQADWMNGEVPKAVEAWDKKEPVYCYCRSGGRSGAAAKYLRDAGFESVFNVGGYVALKGR